MKANNIDDSAFIIIGLFLLVIISLMLVIELIIWLAANLKFKNLKVNEQKSFQTLLQQEHYDGTIKKVKWTIKFNNYNKKKNCLKLTKRNFAEKSFHSFYHNLISVLLVQWKKNNKKTNIALITSTITCYLSVTVIIICTLIYYLNSWNNSLKTINLTALSILSFISLLTLVLSWLTWSMNYEKLRKELIVLANDLVSKNVKLIRAIKIISNYKTLFPDFGLLL